MAANIAITILYMAVYSHAIDTGHDKAYYEAHVQRAAPYCSIIAGIPLMFLAGWWAGGVRDALIIWAIYAVADVAIVALAGATFRMGALVAISLLTKFAAAWLGARAGT